MKKTKKLLALALATMMALSCMAMPAMAAGEDEGIMPLGRVTYCSVCQGPATLKETTRPGQMQVTSCDRVPNRSHYHDAIIVTATIECTKGHSISRDTVYLGPCCG